ncbi:MAG: SRPBCC family protein [Prevotellaceae bacterium]|jgi:hypothetical protein|nr:SRPBCC family protein [Prevotellaceae bacterium]
MTTYESKITTVFKPQSEVFEQLSDLRNLEKFRTQIPEQYDFTCEEDFVSVKNTPFGNAVLRIIERECPKTLKFTLENMPIQANLWVQLKETAPSDTKLKITIKAEIPFFLKPMIAKKLEEGINTMAETLAFALNK